MLAGEMEERLGGVIRARGLDVDRLEPRAAWQCFLEFAGESVDGADRTAGQDVLLVETFASGRGQPVGSVTVDLIRAVSCPDGDGEYAGTERVVCSLVLEPSGEIADAAPLQEWGSEEPLSVFAARVAATPAMEAILRVGRTSSSGIDHGAL